MIDFILDLMEQIVESLCNIITTLADLGKYLAFCFMYLVLILTIPLWILPLRIWRRRRSVTKSITKTITKTGL